MKQAANQTETQSKPKFRAVIEFADGRQAVVLPHSKKTGLFASTETAFRAIERAAARTSNARRGLVTATGDGDFWQRTQAMAL